MNKISISPNYLIINAYDCDKLESRFDELSKILEDGIEFENINLAFIKFSFYKRSEWNAERKTQVISRKYCKSFSKKIEERIRKLVEPHNKEADYICFSGNSSLG